MEHDGDTPRPPPTITLLSSLSGQVRRARDLVPKAGPDGDGATAPAPKTRPRRKDGVADSGGPRARRAPRKPTPERLWAVAQHQAEQREMSSAGLERILMRRVARYCAGLDGEERAAAQAQAREDVEATIARAQAAALVDDARYAALKAGSWRRKGWGERRIAMEMRRQGITPDLAQDALVEADGEVIEGIEDPHELARAADMEAAETLCRRRRIGPYRKVQPQDGAERSRVWGREMGILARAGFSGDTIKAMLGRLPVDDADVW